MKGAPKLPASTSNALELSKALLLLINADLAEDVRPDDETPSTYE